MPILFFILVVVTPFTIMFYWWNPDTSSTTDLGAMFVVIFSLFAWLFRERTYGRVSVVSKWSFSYSLCLALGAGLSALSGTQSSNLAASIPLIIVAAMLTICALIDGPEYGWQ